MIFACRYIKYLMIMIIMIVVIKTKITTKIAPSRGQLALKEETSGESRV